MATPTVILASASPRRRDLLRQLGYQIEIASHAVDETWATGESPLEHAVRLDREKGLAAGVEMGVVLAADTVVCVDREVLGKPRDGAHALEMLQRLSGREHEVITAVAVTAGPTVHQAHSSTRVWFRDLSTDECIAYWDTGEPADKAGAYAIQGHAAAFITRIEGSYSGVVGLPLYETAILLARAGLPSPTGSGTTA
jgi:nucleoside triphosphate pyrophosphatase